MRPLLASAAGSISFSPKEPDGDSFRLVDEWMSVENTRKHRVRSGGHVHYNCCRNFRSPTGSPGLYLQSGRDVRTMTSLPLKHGSPKALVISYHIHAIWKDPWAVNH
jgi:hypothetical protein